MFQDIFLSFLAVLDNIQTGKWWVNSLKLMKNDSSIYNRLMQILQIIWIFALSFYTKLSFSKILINFFFKKWPSNSIQVIKCIFYLLLLLAHEDSIWSCAWQQSDRDRSENIITGGIDDLVKVWKWWGGKWHYVFVHCILIILLLVT